METHIERKLPHLRQFLNISFGVAIGALTLSMPTALQFQPQSLALQIGIFLFLSLTIVHAWWRQADMMSTTRLMRASTWVILFSRLVLLFWLVFVLRNLEISSVGSGWAWYGVFLSAGLLFSLSTAQQLIILRPLYGKTRVLQRREVITDSLLAIFTLAFAAAGALQPQYFQTWYAPLALIAVSLVVRPVARKMTVWHEPPPPHRGGRRPQQQSSGRGQERQQRTQQRPRQQQSSRSERSSGARRISARALKGETTESGERERREARPREKATQREARPQQRPRRRERTAPEPSETPSEPAPAPQLTTEPAVSPPPADSAAAEVTVPSATPQQEPAEPRPESSAGATEPQDEEQKELVYGRRLSKRGPKPSELASALGEEVPEDLEEIEKVLEESAEVVKPPVDEEITYGRRPRRKKPELLAEEESEDVAAEAAQEEDSAAVEEPTPSEEPEEEASQAEAAADDDTREESRESRVSTDSDTQ